MTAHQYAYDVAAVAIRSIDNDPHFLDNDLRTELSLTVDQVLRRLLDVFDSIVGHQGEFIDAIRRGMTFEQWESEGVPAFLARKRGRGAVLRA